MTKCAGGNIKWKRVWTAGGGFANFELCDDSSKFSKFLLLSLNIEGKTLWDSEGKLERDHLKIG